MTIRVGLVGASGALGQELLAALAEAAREERIDLEPPVLLATGREEGESFPWIDGEDDTLPLEKFSAESIRGLDYALVAVPPKAAGQVVESLRRQGTIVVDASRCFREQAPLFFRPGRPALAGHALVTLPSPAALLGARLIDALRGLNPNALRATVLLPASTAGVAGITELAEGTARLLNGQEPEGGTLPHRLAFNLVPQVGTFTGDETEAERDLTAELRRLVGQPNLSVAATLGLGPWFYGMQAFVSIGFHGAVDLAAVQACLEKGDGLKWLNAPADNVYPMTSLATGDESVLVGRLRRDPVDGGVMLVASMDAVRATAVHAVAALESLVHLREAH